MRKVVLKVDDPMLLGRLPAPVDPPQDITRDTPAVMYVRKQVLLEILDSNIRAARDNGTERDQTAEERDSTAATVARLQSFRTWVGTHPNPYVFIGTYPTPEYEEVSEAE